MSSAALQSPQHEFWWHEMQASESVLTTCPAAFKPGMSFVLENFKVISRPKIENGVAMVVVASVSFNFVIMKCQRMKSTYQQLK